MILHQKPWTDTFVKFDILTLLTHNSAIAKPPLCDGWACRRYIRCIQHPSRLRYTSTHLPIGRQLKRVTVRADRGVAHRPCRGEAEGVPSHWIQAVARGWAVLSNALDMSKGERKKNLNKNLFFFGCCIFISRTRDVEWAAWPNLTGKLCRSGYNLISASSRPDSASRQAVWGDQKKVRADSLGRDSGGKKGTEDPLPLGTSSAGSNGRTVSFHHPPEPVTSWRMTAACALTSVLCLWGD